MARNKMIYLLEHSDTCKIIPLSKAINRNTKIDRKV